MNDFHGPGSEAEILLVIWNRFQGLAFRDAVQIPKTL